MLSVPDTIDEEQPFMQIGLLNKDLPGTSTWFVDTENDGWGKGAHGLDGTTYDTHRVER